jgi:hypothetical protein
VNSSGTVPSPPVFRKLTLCTINYTDIQTTYNLFARLFAPN